MIGVDPRYSGAELANHAMCLGDIPGENCSRQTVDRVVGDGDGFRFVFESLYHEHRPEDFFLHDAHVRGRPAEDGRRDEVTGGKRTTETLSAAEELRSLFDTGCDVRLNSFAMQRRDDRSHLRFGIEPVADANVLCAFDESLDETIV